MFPLPPYIPQAEENPPQAANQTYGAETMGILPNQTKRAKTNKFLQHKESVL